VQVGVNKGSGSEVYATAVYDFMPMLKLMSNKYVLSVCDDIIEQELKVVKEHPENNDFLLTEVHADQLGEDI